MGNVPLCHRTFAHSWVRGWFCGSRKFTSLYKLLGSGKVIQQWFHGGKTKPTGIHFVFLVPRTSHSERNCHLSIPDMVQGSELMTCLHFAWNLGKCETQRESSCSKYWFAKEVEGVGQNLLAPLLLPLSPLPPPSFQLLLPGQGETEKKKKKKRWNCDMTTGAPESRFLSPWKSVISCHNARRTLNLIQSC